MAKRAIKSSIGKANSNGAILGTYTGKCCDGAPLLYRFPWAPGRS